MRHLILSLYNGDFAMFIIKWIESLRAVPMCARKPQITNKELDRLYDGLLFAQLQMRRF